jgi:hypothetical protein
MSGNQALMAVAVNVDPSDEAAWNRWYDTRHIPQRQALPGFLTARRFELAETTGQGRKYLALYDLAGPEALESQEYLSLSREPVQSEEDRHMLAQFRDRLRGIMTLTSDVSAFGAAPRDSAEALLVVALDPEPNYEAEFNAWYDEEHVPYLTQVPGVLGVRRFRRIRDDLPYLAIWELADGDVRGSDEWKRAARTPWTARILSHCKWVLNGTYRPLATVVANPSAGS